MKRSQRIRRLTSRIFPALLFIAFSGTAAARTPQEKRQAQPTNPQGLTLQAARKIEFSTDEGTWISPDVSSDGRQIVFDLPGRLYTPGVDGRNALPITSGFSLESQPKFSPDGKQIVFGSDRSGAQNDSSCRSRSRRKRNH